MGSSLPPRPSHSVQHHLHVGAEAYDEQVLHLVPGYEALLDEVVAAVLEHLPRPEARVLDLGAGTGALSQRLAERLPSVQLTLLDVDPAMLAQARVRLAPHAARVHLVESSFQAALPRCDLAVASLSLHHLPTLAAKEAAYRAVHQVLPSRGVLVSGDAVVSVEPALSRPLMQRWAEHLVAHGDSPEQARDRFASWATEDRYLGVEQELDLLRDAGFEAVDVRWRAGPLAVLVGWKA